jgi:outer membrane protein
MNRWFLFLSFVTPVSVAQTVTAGEEVVTAAKLRQLLEKNNAFVVASRLELEASSHREGVFKRSFLPSIQIYGGHERLRFGSEKGPSDAVYGVDASVNLYNGGRDLLKNEMASLEVSRKSVQIKRVTAQELDQARTLYWQVISLKEEAALLKMASKINNQNLTSAVKRIRSGVAANSDRFEFEMKEADLRRELSKIELKFKEQAELLRLALGISNEVDLVFNEELHHEHNEDSLKLSSENQYDFLFKEQELLGQQYSLKAKERRREWWPKLDAFAAFSKSHPSNSEVSSASEKNVAQLGLRMTIDIPSGLDAQREALALDQEAVAANLMAAYRRKEATVHLKSELAQLKLLHEQVHETEQNITRAERYYKITQAEYQRGVKNSPDVLGASDKLFEARYRRLETIRDYEVAKSHVMSKIGL